jgi:succinate dehydrogenase flavin-adding protein (antitoxin of CptAB toxin-antitoxin module)
MVMKTLNDNALTEYMEHLKSLGLSHNDSVELEKILEVLDVEIIKAFLKRVNQIEKAANCKSTVAARALIEGGINKDEGSLVVLAKMLKGDL